MVRGAEVAFDEGIIAHLIEGEGFGVGVQEDVSVGVDEAGDSGEIWRRPMSGGRA